MYEMEISKQRKQKQQEALDRRSANHNHTLERIHDALRAGTMSEEEARTEAQASFLAAFDEQSGSRCNEEDGLARLILAFVGVGTITAVIYTFMN